MFFIIGNPRSGTSLFRLLLTSHTHLHIPPECGFMLWWFKDYSDWTLTDNDSRLDRFLESLYSARKFEFWKINRGDLRAYLQNQKIDSYAELCQSIYRYHAQISRKTESQLGDKNNFHLNHIPQIALLYPDAKFIHIIRDGRDVATSYMSMSKIESVSTYRPNLPSNMTKIANEWKANIQTIQDGLNALENYQTLEIRYEDLVEKTDITLTSVCEFLGEKFQPQMLEFYLSNQAQNLEPTDFMAWKARTLGKIDSSAIGKWRNLPSQDIKVFENVCHVALQGYGYKLSASRTNSC